MLFIMLLLLLWWDWKDTLLMWWVWIAELLSGARPGDTGLVDMGRGKENDELAERLEFVLGLGGAGAGRSGVEGAGGW